MKQLLILTAAVIVLLMAWLIFSQPSGPADGMAPLIVPENAADKAGLIRSAHQLWKAKPNYYDPRRVLALLGVLNSALDDEQWRAVTAAAFFAWENHRGMESVRGTLATLNKGMLPRWARAGTLDELEAMIRIANEASFDAAAIDAALLDVIRSPLGGEGYEDSRAAIIVAAAIRGRDLKRAKAYLGKITWKDPASADVEASVKRVASIVDLCLAADQGKYDLVASVRTWQGEGNATGRTVLRPILEEVALRLMGNGRGSAASPKKIAEEFLASAGEEGAQEYWGRVAARFIPFCTEGNEAKNENLAALANAFGKRFGKPDFAFLTWMKVAQSIVASSPEDPLRAVACFERALSAAVTDAHRVQGVKGAVAGCIKSLEFKRGRKLFDEVAAKVVAAESKKDLASILDDLKKKEAADLERVAKQEKALDLDFRRGRLQAMKDKLTAAKRSGRPSDELAAIESAIKSLEKTVTE